MRIYNPERAKYRKRLVRRKSCFFCDAKVVNEQLCDRFSSVHWLVLVNRYPYLNGNVMLVPKRHVIRLEDITSEEWGEFPVTLLEVQRVLGKKFRTESFNVGLNIGPDSGASVAHLHWQIIPRHRKNHTAVGMFADIHVITTSPAELKRMLSKKKPPISEA